MNEKPILFSPEMVRAILAGEKTETRRIVRAPRDPDSETARSPYGGAGDTLWVRESFCSWVETHDPDSGFNPDPEPERLSPADYIRFKASPRLGMRRWHDTEKVERITFLHESTLLDRAPGPRLKSGQPHWAPSIFFPRWACRLRLRVLDVRIERLQDIDDAGALAEGVSHEQDADLLAQAKGLPRARFAVLWDTINGKRGPWASNPWIWVVRFERMES